jgi:hypothetical protein
MIKRLLGLAALLAFSAHPAFATDYVYDISPSALSPFLVGGYVVTNCDQCVVTSANVVAWSLIQNEGMFGSTTPSVLTSSSLPQASATVQGTGFTATSSGLFFNFNYNVRHESSVIFANNNNFAELSNFGWGSVYNPPAGEVADCGPLACVGLSTNASVEFGNFAKIEAPELGAGGLAGTLTLLLSGLAMHRGRSRRPSCIRTRDPYRLPAV